MPVQETWESDVMESESDRGNSDDDEDYAAAFNRERVVDEDSAEDSTPFRPKPRKVLYNININGTY